MWGAPRRRLPEYGGLSTDAGHALQSRSTCQEVHRTWLAEEEQHRQQSRRPGTIVRGVDRNSSNGGHLGRLGRELQRVASLVGGHAHRGRRQHSANTFTAPQLDVDLRTAAVGVGLGSGWCSSSTSSLHSGMSTSASVSDHAVATRLLPKPTPLIRTDLGEVPDEDCHQSKRCTDLQLAKWRQSQLRDSLAKESCQNAPNTNESVINDSRSLVASKSGGGGAADKDPEGLLSCQDACALSDRRRGEHGCRDVCAQHCQAKQGAWIAPLGHYEQDVIRSEASPRVSLCDAARVLHASAAQHNVWKGNPCAAAQSSRACFAKLEHEAEGIAVQPHIHTQQERAASESMPMATRHATCARRWNSAESRQSLHAAGPVALTPEHQCGSRTRALELPAQTRPDVATVPTPRRLVSVYTDSAVTEVPEFPEHLRFEPRVAEEDVARLQISLSTENIALDCKRRSESTKWLLPSASGIGSLFDELRSAAGTSSTDCKDVAEQLSAVSEGGDSGHVTPADAFGESPPSFASERAFEQRDEAMPHFGHLSLPSPPGPLSTASMAGQHLAVNDAPCNPGSAGHTPFNWRVLEDLGGSSYSRFGFADQAAPSHERAVDARARAHAECRGPSPAWGRGAEQERRATENPEWPGVLPNYSVGTSSDATSSCGIPAPKVLVNERHLGNEAQTSASVEKPMHQPGILHTAGALRQTRAENTEQLDEAAHKKRGKRSASKVRPLLIQMQEGADSSSSGLNVDNQEQMRRLQDKQRTCSSRPLEQEAGESAVNQASRQISKHKRIRRKHGHSRTSSSRAHASERGMQKQQQEQQQQKEQLQQKQQQHHHQGDADGLSNPEMCAEEARAETEEPRRCPSPTDCIPQAMVTEHPIDKSGQLQGKLLPIDEVVCGMLRRHRADEAGQRLADTMMVHSLGAHAERNQTRSLLQQEQATPATISWCKLAVLGECLEPDKHLNDMSTEDGLSKAHGRRSSDELEPPCCWSDASKGGRASHGDEDCRSECRQQSLQQETQSEHRELSACEHGNLDENVELLVGDMPEITSAAEAYMARREAEGHESASPRNKKTKCPAAQDDQQIVSKSDDGVNAHGSEKAPQLVAKRAEGSFTNADVKSWQMEAVRREEERKQQKKEAVAHKWREEAEALRKEAVRRTEERERKQNARRYTEVQVRRQEQADVTVRRHTVDYKRHEGGSLPSEPVQSDGATRQKRHSCAPAKQDQPLDFADLRETVSRRIQAVERKQLKREAQQQLEEKRQEEEDARRRLEEIEAWRREAIRRDHSRRCSPHLAVS